MRTHLPMIVALAVSGHLLVAQSPPVPPSDGSLPTFRTGVEAIQVDAFVTDAAGLPVRGLTADEFVVLENGVPRPLVAFAPVDLPIGDTRGPVDGWVPDPDVRTNLVPPGRLFIFALDEIRAADALRIRVFLRWFLEEYFGPEDMGAVVLIGRGLITSGHGFTRSARRLLDAIEGFGGGFGAGAPGCEDRGTPVTSIRSMNNPEPVPVRQRMAALRDLMTFAAEVPGGRKTVLYFTDCIGLDMFDVIDYRGGVLTLAMEDAHAAMAAATRGNVILYPLNPAGLDPDLNRGSMEDRMDMTALAQATGGFSLSNSNAFSRAFERIVVENSTYYSLGFETASPRLDGRYVPVEVRVTRPGLRVRAREGYVAPLGRPPASAPRAASPALAALGHPLDTPGLGLRVVATPYKGGGRDAAVALTIEVDTEAGTPRDLEVTYAVTDDRNRAHPGGRHALVADRETPHPAAVRVASQLSLPEGRYQVRVAAAAGTTTGSVVYDLDVPNFGRGALLLSGLAFTSRAAAGIPTVRPAPSNDRREASRCRPPSCIVPLAEGAPGAEDPLRDVLPGPVSTSRTFDRHDTVMLYAEVYENLRRPPLHTLTLTTTLRAPDGQVRPLTSESRASTAPARPSGGHGFLVTLPLQEIPPGPYVLHVEARSDAGDGAMVSRAIPVTVR